VVQKSPPRLHGRFTDVTRAQTPIHCDQPVLTQGLKDLRSHMPSLCDSETSYCRVTSDWHPRLSHAVASRLYNSHSACRLNCEAMPCNRFGHQSEVRSNGAVGVAKQRHAWPPLCEHNNSDHHFKRQRRAQQWSQIWRRGILRRAMESNPLRNTVGARV
jgi:hypothetical protein